MNSNRKSGFPLRFGGLVLCVLILMVSLCFSACTRVEKPVSGGGAAETASPAPADTPAAAPADPAQETETPKTAEPPTPAASLEATEAPVPAASPEPTEVPAVPSDPAPVTETPEATEAPVPTASPEATEAPAVLSDPIPETKAPEATEAPVPTASPEPTVTPQATPAPVKPTEAPAAVTPVVSAASSARLAETPDAGREYLDKFVFLGDSTTYGIGAYYRYGYTNLCPPEQVWTPSSGTLTLSYYSVATIVYPETGEEISIFDAVSRGKPEILMITLGVNGISFMDEAWFIQDYTALVKGIQEASPDTKIILNSIYPVAASYKYQGDINNDKIRAANGWIERIAVDTGCRFLNSYEALIGSNGYLPETSQNGDGLHLTGEAFGTVMNYIRTHAYQ